MKNKKFTTAAEVCMATAKMLDDLARKYIGVESREYFRQSIVDIADICRRCAAECDSNSENVKPAMDCADRCMWMAETCKCYDQDQGVTDCKTQLLKCEAACRALLNI